MFPIWEGVWVHSAMFIAIISAFHVLASHITVAAGWFNLFLERKAVYENRPELYAYLKRSALGLLVFAYVFGAMAGVGIWQSTTAANPRGISALIHNFVLYWGAEWYMFLIDVVGIIAYYYTFGRVSPRTHLKIAWLLALGGTGTLAIIVGILSFKLTPGNWLQSGLSLEGFYNPTFWPQLFMRFFLMFTITGAWALLIASLMPKNFPERERIIRYAAAFGLLGLVLALIVFTTWYYPALPEHARAILFTPAIPSPTFAVIQGGLILTALGLIFALSAPKLQHPLIALGAMGVLFAAIFGAERTREVMRKPDIIHGYMSSNQLVMTDVPAKGIRAEEQPLHERGMMKNLPFLQLPEASSLVGTQPVAREHQLEVGRLLTLQQCSACHSVSPQTSLQIGEKRLELRSLARLLEARNQTTQASIAAYLGAIGGFPYMHPFVGTEAERQAMAAYLAWLVSERRGMEQARR
ncbi:cytochrome c [Meiothermus sp. QL-1]|uniref:cytochrome c n=1 Tax=Meiothermus sp. QL-1 TaxID=2058095 RepID=UPI000E0C5991|nr:cytochrome c [Meiothermus sp. QL-1]RDI95988.1 cytochrome c [Meiothermus sp. QL-1]